MPTIPTNFDDAHAAIVKLGARFEANRLHYLSPHYQEQEARKDFVDKFFIALGWDVNHEIQTNPYEQEVKIEKSVTTGSAKRRADYSFSLTPHFYKRPRFFVEAKRPQQDIASPDNYFQAIRYSWSHQLPVVVLTDFHSFHIIDSRYRPDIKWAVRGQLAVYNYRDYCDREKFARIYWLFSREAIINDALVKYAETLERPSASSQQQMGLFPGGYQSIDDAFLGSLDGYREDLARSFKRLNPQLSSEQLTEAVQRTLDRLVFTRFLEDKLIEPEPIISRLGTKGSAWKQFVRQCDHLDKLYNGVVYKHHNLLDSHNFRVDDAVFARICDDLTDPASPYDFNAIPVEILGRIYERFLGKVVVATAKEATVKEKPDVRKAGGVYYTPDYVVSYMVDQALGPKVAGKSPEELLKVRIIDTSCGSGSFLIGSYEYLLRELARTFAAQPKLAKKGDVVIRDGVPYLSIQKKREVLIKCIFGIDIDAQAVEVAQVSLYLKLLEDETTASAQSQQLEMAAALLPSLNDNIIVGNSLISPIGDATTRDFSTEWLESSNAVNIYRTFPEVMQREGGFDLVIGNPPYIKEYTNREAFDHVRGSPYFMGKMDIWYLFACRALDMLKPTTGTLAFIATNNWVTNFGAKRLRGKLAVEGRIEQLIDFGNFKVFRDAGIQTMILIVRRDGTANEYSFDFRRLDGKNASLIDAQGMLTGSASPKVVYLQPSFKRREMGEAPYTFSDSSAETLLSKIGAACNFKLDGATEVAQGIVPNPDVVSSQALKLYMPAELARENIQVGTPVFVVPKGFFSNPSQSERHLLKPLLEPSDVTRYVPHRPTRLEIIYSHAALGRPLSGRMLAHLQAFRRIMQKRRETDAGKLPWTCLHWPRDPRFFEGEKILAVRKCQVPTFAFSVGPSFVMMAFNVIKTTRIDQRYLTALLNSTVIRYWLRHRGKMQGHQFQVDKEPLLALPLIAPAAPDQARIATLVNRIIQASAKASEALTDSSRNNYQRIVDQTDSEIQESIYRLYALSEQEIDAVLAQ